MKVEIEKLRQTSNMAEKSSNRVAELLKQIEELKEELGAEKGEKQDLISEKDLMKKKHAEVRGFTDYVPCSSIGVTIASLAETVSSTCVILNKIIEICEKSTKTCKKLLYYDCHDSSLCCNHILNKVSAVGLFQDNEKTFVGISIKM